MNIASVKRNKFKSFIRMNDYLLIVDVKMNNELDKKDIKYAILEYDCTKMFNWI